MSNRLEHKFPAVHWRATLPRGIDHDLVRAALVRGRQLQRAARRDIIAGALRGVGTFIRYGAHGIAKRAPERPAGPGCRLGA
jgi:hypothetical protein